MTTFMFFFSCIFIYKNNITHHIMENGRIMIVHSLIIGIILYVIMTFLLGQKPVVAENRSILIAAIILAYMILFGHGLPTAINKNLF